MGNVNEILLQTLLARPERGIDPRLVASLRAARPEELSRALDVLAPHKVFPLLAHQLERLGLFDELPAAVRERLDTTRREVRALSALHLLSAAAILRAAALRAERVVALKGLVFADSHYPDFATRPMGDIDLLAFPGRAETLFDLLEASGFRRSESHVVQDDAVAFENRWGLTCDAHRVLRMFEGEPFERLVVETRLRCVHGVSVHVLEPSAMVAHLFRHIHGHAHEIGLVLLWLLDAAFVLRRVGDALDVSRVQRLCGGDAFALFLRTVRMLELAGEPIPEPIARRARFVPPLSLGFVLRTRRVAPWGLASARGWLRLAARTTMPRRHDPRPMPRVDDLMWWPLDALSSRVAPHLASLASPDPG